jgi:hypothetical protein
MCRNEWNHLRRESCDAVSVVSNSVGTLNQERHHPRKSLLVSTLQLDLTLHPVAVSLGYPVAMGESEPAVLWNQVVKEVRLPVAEEPAECLWLSASFPQQIVLCK